MYGMSSRRVKAVFLAICLGGLSQGLLSGAIRDGGVDPANLGKGEWLFYMSSATNQLGGYVPGVTDENTLMQYLKSKGTRYVIVKAATSDQLFNGSYSHPQFTSNLVQAAHAHGLWIFGYNRSYGQNVPAEIAIADYVFQQGADGFVWDAEAEWESYQSWIGTNGPALAWELCSTVRSNWPTKFLAHSPFAIIGYHASFPYKEFGYWCDAVMPQIYHFSAARAPSAAINWSDVNWHYYQNLWSSLPPQNINGLAVYWTNAIKPIVPIQDVYGPPYSSPTPDKDVQEFIDYLAADPHAPTAGGYAGANFFRADLHDQQQWDYISEGSLGNVPGRVNNIVMDDAAATSTGTVTPVRTYYLTNNTLPRFEGSGSGTDRNSFGTNYVQLNQGTGNNYVQFTPTIRIPGEYKVYQWHPDRSEASANVPFVITHIGGTTTVFANQQTNGGNWTLLGTFTFAAGTSGSIRITDEIPEPSGIAMADGIKLVFASPASVLPLAPSGISAEALAGLQIEVNWSNNATNAVHNVVSRSTSNAGPYYDVAVLPSTSTSWVDADLAGETTYYYLVRAVNAAGSSPTLGPASATSAAAPPVITQQPQSQIVSVDSSVTFTVVVASTLPLTYQWKRDGTNLAGATQSSYPIPSVQLSDAGLYSVAVTNAAGGVTSLGFTLTVLPELVALNVSTTPGGTVTKTPNAATYVPGTIVGLTAIPATGYLFTGWSGDITSTENPLWVTMSGETSVTATFTPAIGEIILDNTSPNVTFSGSWATGTTAAGRYGADYRFSGTIQSGSPSTGTYRPILPAAGLYRVYTMYPAGGNRAYSTPFTIQTDSGPIQVTINQQQNGGVWLPLTAQPVHLTPGNDIYVEISNLTGYSGSVVIADAVRFELIQADLVEPTIIEHPADRIVSTGGTASFSIVGGGASPLSYQWLRNGEVVSGATESIYIINQVQPDNSGDEFRCRLSNSFGEALSSSAYLTVVEDETYVFSANFESGLQGFTTANLYGNGSSLWHLSTGRGIDPSHSPTHSLYYGKSEGPGGGGNYNTGTANGGTATSPIITLPDVEGPIWLSFNYLMQVQYGTYYDRGIVEVSTDGGVSYIPVAEKDWYGGLFSFSTVPGNSNSISPAWVSNRIDLANFSGSDIQVRFRFDTIDAFNNAGEGWYLDDIAIVAPAKAAAIAQHPQDVTGEVGTQASFFVVASGASPLSYHWQRNGQPIQGATDAYYTLSPLQLSDSGAQFSCLVSNAHGIALSEPAELTVVGYPPTIYSQPYDQNVPYGYQVSFGVWASGTAPLSYNWYRDGVPIPDATNASYYLPFPTGADSGAMFSCVVTNAFGSGTTTPAKLTVQDPFISSFPWSLTADAGTTLTISVTALGSAPLSYEWWKDGVVLSANSSELSIPSVQPADAGQYRVVVSNQYGSVTSSVATVAVNLATLDPGFQANPNDMISAVAIQADGRILVGGYFTSLNGKERNYIARLHQDGSLDDTFNPGANGPVLSLLVQPDGKVVAGGSFTSASGQSRNRIARFNPDGSLDASFNPSANDTVACMALQSNGRILLGGHFTTIGGAARSRIVRVDGNGNLDTTFSPVANDAVLAMAVQADGRIVVGGYFTALAGQTRYYLGRLSSSGTLDSTLSSGASSPVTSIVQQSDGKIVIGGSFAYIGNEYRSGVARFNLNGTPDLSFNANGYYYTYVNGVGLQTDGKILAGGDFTSLGGQDRQNLARLHPDGTADDTFVPGGIPRLNCLALQQDGRVLAGTSYGGADFFRLNSTYPATDDLGYQGTTIRWMRGGTGPEVFRTTFEYSVNGGATWSLLGPGTRTNGGWIRPTGLSLAGVNIRARGFTGDGRSSSIIQSISGPLMLVSGPPSQTRDAGGSASFTVVAGGTGPISYQWFKDGLSMTNGGNVSGAQSSTLVLDSVFGPDSGGYSVILSSAQASITSSVATLTVIDPVITSHPTGENKNLGEDVTLHVEAAGSLPLSYTWWKDGSEVTEATGSSLTITNLQAIDAGQYVAVVSNHYGMATSHVALVSINLATADENFDPRASGNVFTTAVQPDGKVLVGGWFYYMGDVPRYFLARLNADGTLDQPFDPAPDGGVYAIAVQPDGKILIGGAFTMVGQTNRNRIARLNQDGSVDATFVSSASDLVMGIALQPDGKIIVAGYFSLLDGQARGGIGRLNPNGTLDTSFAIQADGAVSALTMQNDGRILVGGSFSTLGGVARPGMGRITSAGTLDSSFNPSPNGNVSSIVVQADGKVVVGGYFSTLGGQTRHNLGRLNSNGTLDASFNAGTLPYETVYTLALQADGKILVGGMFSSLAGQPRANIGRLNPNGTADTSFNPGANYLVNSLTIQKDGKIVVGGGFNYLGGQYRLNIGRLNSTSEALENISQQPGSITWTRGGSGPEVFRTTFEYSTNSGSSWVSIGPGVRVLNGWQCAAAFPFGDANIRGRGFIAGGRSGYFIESFGGPLLMISQPLSRTNNAGTPASLTVDADGSQPIAYQWLKDGFPLTNGASMTGAQSATLSWSSVFGPDTGNYSVVISNNYGSITSAVARLTVIDPVIIEHPISMAMNRGENADLSVSAIGSPPLGYQWWKDGSLLPQANDPVLTLTNLQASSAGQYTVVVSNQYGSATSEVAVLTVNLALVDETFDPKANSSVYTMAIQPDGKIVVGGWFDNIAGVPRARIARLNADGTLDETFNPGVNDAVFALAVLPDGKILVGGIFTSVAGSQRQRIARLNSNGTLDTSFNVSANDAVLSFAVQPDGKVLMGGFFTMVGSQNRNRIARLNANGTLDASFNPSANDGVYSIALQNDGKVVLGGIFSSLAGQNCYRLGRLNANGTLDTSFTPNPTYSVYSMVVQPDNKIIVGGSFDFLAGSPRYGLGRLNADGTLDTSFDPGTTYGTHMFSLVLQADGKIVAGGNFYQLGNETRYNIGRLHPDGSVDLTFNVFVDNAVYALAIQSDGQLVVGGAFWYLGNYDRLNIGRLQSTDPALQSFAFEPSALNWRRGGTSPEFSQTLLDYSTNGTTWQSFGAGTRLLPSAPGELPGWRWTNLPLELGSIVRLRGYVSGGQFSSSCWVIETNIVIGVPQIVSQPVDVTCNVGEDVGFTASAGGLTPLAYQWLKDGTALLDATGPSLLLTNVQEIDQGAYTLVVSNAFGHVLSAEALLVVNQAPIADAGATSKTFISPNGTDAKVVLDGTMSSDPDDDLLTYLWLEPETFEPLADGAVAVLTLPLGTYSMLLVVSDGMLQSTNELTLEVLSASTAVERLVAAASEGLSRSQQLIATLSAAIASIDRSNPISAINQLQAFQNQVLAQVYPIDPVLAQEFIDLAQSVIDALSQNPGVPGHGKVSFVTHQPGRTVRLRFPAHRGPVYIVEASTNLLTWEKIGVAVNRGDGTFDFEDKHASKFRNRFYRIVFP